MKSLVQKLSYFVVFLLCSILMSCHGDPPFTGGKFTVIENPAVSPDGNRITFASFVYGDTVPLHSQYIVSIDGGEECLLFRKRVNAGTESCWSPDGKQIATAHGIFTIENNTVTDFRSKSSDMYLFKISDWSPDGKTLLLYFKTEVYLCDTLFKNIRELPFRAFNPRWMSDGNHIIGEIWSTVWAGTEIGITDTLCSEMVRLTYSNINENYQNPAPSPDGAMIAFHKFDGIYVMNSDGNNHQFLDEGRDPAWTPDSKCIVYVKNDLWKISLDSKEKIQITNMFKQ